MNHPQQTLYLSSVPQKALDGLANLKAFRSFGKTYEEKRRKILNIDHHLEHDLKYFLEKIRSFTRLNFSKKSLEKISHAYLLAAIGHRGQTRGDGDTPYINHVTRIAISTAVDNKSIGRDEDYIVSQICIALLHDLPEDTESEDDFHELNGHIGDYIGNTEYEHISELTKPDKNDFIHHVKNKHLDEDELKQEAKKLRDIHYLDHIGKSKSIKINDNIDYYASSESVTDPKMKYKIDHFTDRILQWGYDDRYKIGCMALIITMRKVGIHINMPYKHSTQEDTQAQEKAKLAWKLARTVHVSKKIDINGNVSSFIHQNKLGTVQYPYDELREEYQKQTSNLVH